MCSSDLGFPHAGITGMIIRYDGFCKFGAGSNDEPVGKPHAIVPVNANGQPRVMMPAKLPAYTDQVDGKLIYRINNVVIAHSDPSHEIMRQLHRLTVERIRVGCVELAPHQPTRVSEHQQLAIRADFGSHTDATGVDHALQTRAWEAR